MASFQQKKLMEGKEIHPDLLLGSGKLEELKRLDQAGELDLRSWTDVKTSRTLFHLAAESNQVEAIHFLASVAFSSVNAQDCQGNTALHVAVSRGHNKVTCALLNYKVDSTVLNYKAETPLLIALRRQDKNALHCIKSLIQHPEDEQSATLGHMYSYLRLVTEHDNVQAFQMLYSKLKESYPSAAIASILFESDQNGATIMHFTARMGAYIVMEYLFSISSECGLTNADLMSAVSSEKRTPLHYAVENDHLNSARVLLKHGASCSSLNGSHCPPVHRACVKGNIPMLKLMVEINGVEILQSQDKLGRTVLHSCAFSPSSKDMISFLVRNGAAVDVQDQAGLTPLANAILLGAASAVESLLESGADPLAKNKNGCNALHLATTGKRFDVFEKIIASDKVQVMMQDCSNEGLQPIHYVLKIGQIDMLRSLLLLSEDPVKDSEGNNFVHLAILSRSHKTLPYLMKYPFAHAMINEPNHVGLTPLHYAAMKANPNATQYLIEGGATIHKSKDGLTPFMYACSNGHFETAKLLFYVNKFQRNWTDHNGNTSLHLAVEGRNPNILTFCLDKGTAITRNDDGVSFFDKIIDKEENQLAEAALQHERWEECLDCTSLDRRPCLIRIVDEIPKVYGTLLDKCFTKSTHDPTNYDYWEEFNFKGVTLSSQQQLYPPGKLAETPSKDDLDNIEMNISIQSSDYLLETHSADDLDDTDNLHIVPAHAKSRDCRPFSIIHRLIDSKHNLYLLHPVVEAFIRTRWSGFHECFYLVKLFIHFFLALILTISLTTTFHPGSTESNITTVISPNATVEEYFSAGELALLITVLLTALLSLFIGLVEVIHRYFSIQEAFQGVLLLNFVAAVFTTVFACLLLADYANSILWSIAAIAVCFTWLSVGFNLQLINIWNIGVYITIIISTAKVAFKVLAIISFLFLAFAVPLHILVGKKDPLHFSTIGLSVFSVFTSLLAIIDVFEIVSLNDTGNLESPVVVYVLLIVLLIFLPIITINVLIGLAVGDIDKLQKNAIISRRAVEVRALAHLDHIALPEWLFKRHSLTHHRDYPNHRRGVWQWITSTLYHYKGRQLYMEESENSTDVVVRMILVEERKIHEKNMAKLTKKIEEIVAEKVSAIDLPVHSTSRRKINTIIREDTGHASF